MAEQNTVGKVIQFSDYKKKEETEICVLCEIDTGIPWRFDKSDSRRNDNKDTWVGNHYIEGGGQLCDFCFAQIFTGGAGVGN